MLFVRCTFRQNVYTDWQRSIASNGDMSGPIKLAFKHVFQFYVAVYIILSWFSLAKFKATAAEINDHTKLFPEQNEGNWFSVVFFCIYLFIHVSFLLLFSHSLYRTQRDNEINSCKSATIRYGALQPHHHIIYDMHFCIETRKKLPFKNLSSVILFLIPIYWVLVLRRTMK